MSADEGNDRPPRTGDPCEACDGHLVVYSGHSTGVLHVRYLRCWRCRAKPPNNKVIVPAAEVAKRHKRFCPNNVTSPISNEPTSG